MLGTVRRELGKGPADKVLSTRVSTRGSAQEPDNGAIQFKSAFFKLQTSLDLRRQSPTQTVWDFPLLA